MKSNGPRFHKVQQQKLASKKSQDALSGQLVTEKQAEVRHVSVYVEQDGANKFKIQSDQLEQIGAQLRGPREFSIFQSITLPIIVTLATLIFTSLFQYISWSNSVALQNAADVATNAERAYEKSVVAIGARRYAMFVYLPSLRDLVKAKASVEANARARVERSARLHDEIRNAESSPLQPSTGDTKPRTLAETYATTSAILPPEATKDNETSLDKSLLELHKQRFASYYRHLKLWNENYDQLLSEIEYALDRPVFSQAERQSERTSYGKFLQINCSKSLTDELLRLQLSPDSIKFRFAGINKCFMDTHAALDHELTEAKSRTEHDFDPSTELKIKTDLESILSKANAFRCYALRRIEYYRAQKELSILSFSYVLRLMTHVAKTEALKHFDDTAKTCAEDRSV
jgi:hypothetical protein